MCYIVMMGRQIAKMFCPGSSIHMFYSFIHSVQQNMFSTFSLWGSPFLTFLLLFYFRHYCVSLKCRCEDTGNHFQLLSCWMTYVWQAAWKCYRNDLCWLTYDNLHGSITEMTYVWQAAWKHYRNDLCWLTYDKLHGSVTEMEVWTGVCIFLNKSASVDL